MRRIPPALLALPAALALTACSGGSPGQTISVSSTDSDCVLSATDVAAGAVTFTVTNDGSETTELYVYAEDGTIVSEVEDVTPGLSRDLTVTLAAGTYELACKPGERDPGFRASLAVTS